MARPGRPTFLAPAPYRRRRLRDAARLLPVLGALLMLVPLLWTPSAQPGGVGGARALLYLFGAWALLVALAAALAGPLGRDADEP